MNIKHRILATFNIKKNKSIPTGCMPLNITPQINSTGRWFPPVFSTNKADRHNITEILLKLTFNTINLIKPEKTPDKFATILHRGALTNTLYIFQQ
jgi:hypothetical protein